MSETVSKADFARLLWCIKQNDPYTKGELLDNDARERLYFHRNRYIIKAVAIAQELGYKAGYAVRTPIEDFAPSKRVEPFSYPPYFKVITNPPKAYPTFGVVAIIHLPIGGQVSWVLDSRDMEWDNHSIDEKFSRLDEYIQQYLQGNKEKYDVEVKDVVAKPSVRISKCKEYDDLCATLKQMSLELAKDKLDLRVLRYLVTNAKDLIGDDINE